MTVIEVKPRKWGWCVFESPGVEPVFVEKDQAIGYAETRARLRTGEIRMFDSTGRVPRLLNLCRNSSLMISPFFGCNLLMIFSSVRSGIAVARFNSRKVGHALRMTLCRFPLSQAKVNNSQPSGALGVQNFFAHAIFQRASSAHSCAICSSSCLRIWSSISPCRASSRQSKPGACASTNRSRNSRSDNRPLGSLARAHLVSLSFLISGSQQAISYALPFSRISRKHAASKAMRQAEIPSFSATIASRRFLRADISARILRARFVRGRPGRRGIEIFLRRKFSGSLTDHV